MRLPQPDKHYHVRAGDLWLGGNEMVGIRVTAIESRRAMAEHLQQRLDLPDTHIIWDDRPQGGNAMYTVKKAWRDPLEDGETHRVVLNEDTEVCNGFREIIEQVAQAQPDCLMVLFTTALNGHGYDDYVQDLQTPYVDHTIGLFGCAIMMPARYIEPCFAWIEQNCDPDIWDNAGILAWLRHSGLPIRTTMPLLVQHIGDDSVVDPTMPIRRSERFEMDPAADWSCSDVAAMPELDWFKPINWSDPKRQLTLNEVMAMVVKDQINKLEVDDKTALRMVGYYPSFQKVIGQTVHAGFKLVHNGRLYKVLQEGLLIQELLEPGAGTESLYARIDEEHTGTKDDPIPYEGNMELSEGLFYSQDGKIYRCIRSTGMPVIHALADLVGLYVEEIGE